MVSHNQYTKSLPNYSPYIVFAITVSYMALCWILVNRGLGVSFPGSEPFPEKQEGSQDTADYHRNYQLSYLIVTDSDDFKNELYFNWHNTPFLSLFTLQLAYSN